MTILEMIAEWRTGCSCAAPGFPEQCPTCTLGLILAIERRVQPELDKAHWDGYCKGKEAAYKDFSKL